MKGTFQKRHYCTIAAVIASLPQEMQMIVAAEFIAVLEADNARFDAGKFWEAIRKGRAA